MPGERPRLSAVVDPGSPPEPTPERDREVWWRRRALPPGPTRLLHGPFIAIADRSRLLQDRGVPACRQCSFRNQTGGPGRRSRRDADSRASAPPSVVQPDPGHSVSSPCTWTDRTASSGWIRIGPNRCGSPGQHRASPAARRQNPRSCHLPGCSGHGSPGSDTRSLRSFSGRRRSGAGTRRQIRGVSLITGRASADRPH